MEEVLKLKKASVDKAKKNSGGQFQFTIERSPRLFRKALSREGVNIIAEIKRASPSKGVINDRVDVEKVAVEYQNSGVCAISVLTEEDRFLGSSEDLIKVRRVTDLPILRKDFIFDEFQILESKSIGADAVLLIVKILSKEKLKELLQLAESLGMDALVEVHTRKEMEVALEVGAKIIGVNNRDLRSFEVSLDVSRELIKCAPRDVLMVSESGISRKEEILELRSLGFSAFLIGETLMKSENISEKLKALL